MISVVLQVGLPGAQEMMIIFLNLILFAGVIGGVIFVFQRLTGSDSDTDERVAELEREVEELREERKKAAEPDDELE